MDVHIKLIDGDEIRSGLNRDLGYSIEDRTENIRRVAELNKIILAEGITCINCFISPTMQIRSMAKEIIGDLKFKMIHIDASLQSCELRDVKGLYRKARSGEINEFTGIHSPYEIPGDADLVINTEETSIAQAVEILYNFMK